MVISVSLHHLTHSFFSSSQQNLKHKSVHQGWSERPGYCFSNNSKNKLRPIKASVETPPFPLFQPPQVDESDSDGIGYVRSMRAYGVEFKEGRDGFGVYASKDVEPRRRARVVMEIPLELMITIRQKLPWMFFPDIVPIGHPIFDIINSTDPEVT
ncbi:hypothetical protein Patl1_12000 [Pistacia atlantica]|uniref:Uncharacterized protein n=1 Tax=Pistacia atlantica TaxID=434234 RepID=A0ACC1A7J2_9ROSI|nr:hypothetical protein Patl1_12000 [Pistacia atlantica]